MRPALLLVLSLSLCAWERSKAQDAPPLEERPRAIDEFTSALEEKTRKLLEELPPGAVLVRVRNELPTSAPRLHDLSREARDAARRGIESSGRPFALELTTERSSDDILAATARGYVGVIVWSLGRDRGSLVADGQLLATSGRGWSRIFRRGTERRGHAVARIPLDAELRSYAGGPRRFSARDVVARSMDLPSRNYLAVEAFPRLDGATLLVLVRAHGIETLRLDTTKNELTHGAMETIPFDGVSRAAVGSRRPIATMRREPSGLVVRSSEHAPEIVVALEDEVVRVAARSATCPRRGHLIDDGCARRVEGRDHFEPAIDGRQPSAAAPPPANAPFYGRRVRAIRQPSGEIVRFEAYVSIGGRLSVRTNRGKSAATGFGAALALADVDADGLPEVLASSSHPIGQGDRLTVLRIRPDGSLVTVWSSEPLAGSVLVAGSADLDGDGLEELLAIEEPAPGETVARLWVIR